jgi:hypothetical protein
VSVSSDEDSASKPQRRGGGVLFISVKLIVPQKLDSTKTINQCLHESEPCLTANCPAAAEQVAVVKIEVVPAPCKVAHSLPVTLSNSAERDGEDVSSLDDEGDGKRSSGRAAGAVGASDDRPSKR